MRSTSSCRLGRPVSASCVACMVSAACARWRSHSWSVWAALSRAISRSCAFWALRSVNVRQIRWSSSSPTGDTPTSTGIVRPSTSTRSISIAAPSPEDPRTDSQSTIASLRRKAESLDPRMSSSEHDRRSASRWFAYNTTPVGDSVAAPSRMFSTKRRYGRSAVDNVNTRRSLASSEKTKASISPRPIARSVSSASPSRSSASLYVRFRSGSTCWRPPGHGAMSGVPEGDWSTDTWSHVRRVAVGNR